MEDLGSIPGCFESKRTIDSKPLHLQRISFPKARNRRSMSLEIEERVSHPVVSPTSPAVPFPLLSYRC